MEPLPSDHRVLDAWAHFHNGEFEKASAVGLKLGEIGLNVAQKATCIYATYLEKQESHRLALYQEVANRADQHIISNPDNLNAYYWRAYALGHYSQGISVAKALAQGLGTKIKTDLEHVIELQPKHPDAHIALGSFHAEVIDKVGELIGAMAYGAHRDTGLKLFTQALDLHLQSAIGMVEYARALMMLDGEKMVAEATRMYQLAAGAHPVDAMERLDVELARTELAD
jgi:tetratricopeptide (TPR) repeat protein